MRKNFLQTPQRIRLSANSLKMGSEDSALFYGPLQKAHVGASYLKHKFRRKSVLNNKQDIFEKC